MVSKELMSILIQQSKRSDIYSILEQYKDGTLENFIYSPTVLSFKAHEATHKNKTNNNLN